MTQLCFFPKAICLEEHKQDLFPARHITVFLSWLVFFSFRSGPESGARSSSVAQPHWRSLIFRLGHCLGIFRLNFTNNLLCKEFPVLPFCDLMPWVWFFWNSLRISIRRGWSVFAAAVVSRFDGSGSWCSWFSERLYSPVARRLRASALDAAHTGKLEKSTVLSSRCPEELSGNACG